MKLTGFTLFQTAKGWQLSVRNYPETGWSVHTSYPDNKAQEILNTVSRLLPEVPVAPPVRGQLSLRPPRRERVRLDD